MALKLTIVFLDKFNAYKGKDEEIGTGLVTRGTVRPQQLEHSCWTSPLVT